MGVAHRDVGELALEQPDQLWRERVTLVVGVALERQPQHGDLVGAESSPTRRLIPSTRNSGTASFTRETASSIPGRVRALLGEDEVLAQARPGRQPWHRDPSARVIVVDQVDHLEHVRAVALAVHHQQVRERERRVAEDVGPDLRELGLHGGCLHDRCTERGERARGVLGRSLADATDDARERRNLLEEPARGDPLGGVSDVHVVAGAQPAALLQVPGDELRRARRDRRAQDQRVTRAQVREQVIDHGSDAAQVALQMRERRGPDGDHDVVRGRGLSRAVRELEPAGLGDALQQRLGAGLLERHPTRSDRFEDRLVVVDPEHAQPAVGEAQREREPDATETDDRYRPTVFHVVRGSRLGSGSRPCSAGCPRTSPANAS